MWIALPAAPSSSSEMQNSSRTGGNDAQLHGIPSNTRFDLLRGLGGLIQIRQQV